MTLGAPAVIYGHKIVRIGNFIVREGRVSEVVCNLTVAFLSFNCSRNNALIKSFCPSVITDTVFKI